MQEMLYTTAFLKGAGLGAVCALVTDARGCPPTAIAPSPQRFAPTQRSPALRQPAPCGTSAESTSGKPYLTVQPEPRRNAVQVGAADGGD